MKNLILLTIILTISFMSNFAHSNTNVMVQNNTGNTVMVSGHRVEQGHRHVSAYPATIELIDGRKIVLHDDGKYCSKGEKNYKHNGWKFTATGADSADNPTVCTPLSGGQIGCHGAVVQLHHGYKSSVISKDSSACTGEWFKENEKTILTVAQIVGQLLMGLVEPAEIVEAVVEDVEIAEAEAAEAIAEAVKLAEKAIKKAAFKFVKLGLKNELKKMGGKVEFSAERIQYELTRAAHAAIKYKDMEVANRLLKDISRGDICQALGGTWNSSKEKGVVNACSIVI
jgi:hypothetical protein